MLVPTGAPFNVHAYDGVPPFTGVAVNVTFCPVQSVSPVASETILTEAGTVELIVTPVLLLVVPQPLVTVIV